MESEHVDSQNKDDKSNAETKVENDKPRESKRKGSKCGSYMRRDRRNSKSKPKAK